MTALTNKFDVNRRKKFENEDTLTRSLLLLILSNTFGSTGSPAYEEIQTDNSRSYKILELSYRIIPKISPSMYKTLQNISPQTGNANNPPLNRPSKYKPRGDLYLEIALKYKVKH